MPDEEIWWEFWLRGSRDKPSFTSRTDRDSAPSISSARVAVASSSRQCNACPFRFCPGHHKVAGLASRPALPARRRQPLSSKRFSTGKSVHEVSPGFSLQASTLASGGFVSCKSGHVVKCGDVPDFRLNLNLQNALCIPCHLTIVGFDRHFRVFWPRDTPSDWSRVEPASSSAANEPASEYGG
jgi:hypothetical protein